MLNDLRKYISTDLSKIREKAEEYDITNLTIKLLEKTKNKELSERIVNTINDDYLEIVDCYGELNIFASFINDYHVEDAINVESIEILKMCFSFFSEEYKIENYATSSIMNILKYASECSEIEILNQLKEWYSMTDDELEKILKYKGDEYTYDYSNLSFTDEETACMCVVQTKSLELISFLKKLGFDKSEKVEDLWIFIEAGYDDRFCSIGLGIEKSAYDYLLEKTLTTENVRELSDESIYHICKVTNSDIVGNYIYYGIQRNIFNSEKEVLM